MSNVKFCNPILVNPTYPSAGIDIASIDIDVFTKRVGSNTGNMAFLHALMLIIKNLEHNSKRSHKDADIKVWGCSNFINPKTPRKVSNSYIYTDKKPIVLVGLGAQAPDCSYDLEIDSDTQNWISTLSKMSVSHYPNISLRGEYTYKILEKYNLHKKCVILGCPSLFISPNNKLGLAIKRNLKNHVRNIGISPGSIGNIESRFLNIERYLVKILNSHCGSYICQSNPKIFTFMLDNFQKADIDFLINLRDQIYPEIGIEEFFCWFRKHGRVFDNIPSWLIHLRSLDLMVSTRIHGAQLALQAGVPSLCIALDSRQIELCKMLMIPYIEWSQFDTTMKVEDIVGLLKNHDWELYDLNRRMLAEKHIEFFENNGLSIDNQLIRLVS